MNDFVLPHPTRPGCLVQVCVAEVANDPDAIDVAVEGYVYRHGRAALQALLAARDTAEANVYASGNDPEDGHGNAKVNGSVKATGSAKGNADANPFDRSAADALGRHIAGPSEATLPPPAAMAARAAVGRDATGTRLCAPAGGRIAALRVAVGEAVEPGQVVVVLESMKVELVVRAQSAGVVQRLAVAVGDWVEADAVLLTMV